jgi:glutathione S-transferase
MCGSGPQEATFGADLEVGLPDAVAVLYAPDFSTVPVVGCSPSSWACQLVFEEKSVPRQDAWLDGAAGAWRAPEMLARNPRGAGPVLVHGDTIVHETLAILQYIDATWPVPVLVPPRTRGRALTRLHEAAALREASMSLLGWLGRVGPEARTAEAFAPRLTVLWRELRHWERYLGEHAFVAGPDATLADFLVYPCVASFERLGLDLADNLARYAADMRTRSSVVRSWPEPWASDPIDQPLRGLGAD